MRQARTPGDMQERRQAGMAQLRRCLQGATEADPRAGTGLDVAGFMAAMRPAERTARLDRADMEKRTPERIDRMRALRARSTQPKPTAVVKPPRPSMPH